jgi:hypothetical protein
MGESMWPRGDAPQPGTSPRIPHPYQQGLPALVGLVALTFVIVLVSAIMAALGMWKSGVVVLLSMPLALFGLILLIVWLQGLAQVRQATAFLASDRPLIRWTYTPAEWQEIKEAKWQDEKGDWRVQWGCLTALLGLAGLLAGLFIASDDISSSLFTLEAAIELATGALGGAAIGALAGGVIGALVAGGNYLGARNDYRQRTPGHVALAPKEFYANSGNFANSGYFRANGNAITRVELTRGNPTILTIVTYTSRVRGPREEEWEIVVPRRLVDEVEAIVPQIVVSGPGSETEEE